MSNPEVMAELKAAKARAKAARPWYMKKRFWFLGVFVLLMIGSALGSMGSSGGSGTSPAPVTSSVESPASSEPTTEPAPSTETVAQKNARGSAESYLSNQAFSRTGLIKQLEFEGYSTADSTYGVDAQKVDWNDQAAKSGKSYLSNQTFSRRGLIEQLVFEGFTQSQAEFGVSANGL